MAMQIAGRRPKQTRLCAATSDEIEMALKLEADRNGWTVSSMLNELARAHVASQIDLHDLPLTEQAKHLLSDIAHAESDGNINQVERMAIVKHLSEILYGVTKTA